MAAKKIQRIKMRVQGTALKFEGEVIEVSPDAKKFKVRFDGQYPDTEFYQYSDKNLVLDKPRVPRPGNFSGDVPADAKFWEVL